MPMLTCIHHIQWVVPIEGGQHFCNYCKTVVPKKDVYPPWDSLGELFQKKWDAHESAGAAPAASEPAQPPTS